MRKKALFCTLMAVSALAVGCSSQSSPNSTPKTIEESVAEPIEQGAREGVDGTTGWVTAISETELTISDDGRDAMKPDGDGRDAMKPDGDGRDAMKPDGDGRGAMKPDDMKPDAMKPDDIKPGDRQKDTESGAPVENTFTLTSETEFIGADGEMITVSDIKTGDCVTVEAEGDVAVKVTVSSAMGTPGGGHSAPENYDAATEYTQDAEVGGETYTSVGTDENAIHVMNGAQVTLSDITLTRISSDSTGGDSSSFYGIGAGILVSDGTLQLEGADIDTDASGGAGVFAYDKGIAYVTDTTIRTAQDTSGGIHVAGGGTLHAENLTVETDGASSAAIRSDRGGGTMTVKGGSYISNGSGSPAVYCTADITIEDAVLTATGAEAVCIEGLNSLKLTNCSLSGNIPANDQNDCNWTVILYQSMSGDSEVGNSTFEMNGGSLVSQNGGLFYTTNTESTFYLKGVDITYSESDDFFLKCTGNANSRGWGTSGSNGADCVFTADTQTMKGNILWDSVSQLDFEMKNASTLEGAFLQDESAAGSGGTGHASLVIDSSSTWTVTGDSVLTSLECKGTIIGADGKNVRIVGTDGTVYEDGEGAYTVVVETYK